MKPFLFDDSHPARILILDDSAFDRARIRRAINTAGIHYSLMEIECLEALNGALVEKEFDIAILDYDLSDGTGHDALRRIRACKQNSHIVSIMITGNDAPHVAHEALKLGCFSCHSKSDVNSDLVKHVVAVGLRNDWTSFNVDQQCKEHRNKFFVVPKR